MDAVVETPRLRALAYRLLGSAADADDAVQEAYARYYRLSEGQRADLRRPGAWLMRVTGRIALDQLKSARARRVEYVGQWLPEPVPADSDYAAGHLHDPAQAAEQSEAVSYALLVLLERLTPAERAAYVLRESFALPHEEIAEVLGRSAGASRQLVSAARKRLAEETALREVDRAEHNAVVSAFTAAAQTGDFGALVQVLDPEVTVRSDGGGKATAARHPVLGRDNVSRMLIGLRTKNPEAQLTTVEIPGGTAMLMRQDQQVVGLMACAVGPSGLAEVWIMRNPDKLRLWEAAGTG